MAALKFEKFKNNTRIQRAADNAPAIRLGETDHEAVKILQEALIQAGFPIPDGATGTYGPETATAVLAVENRFSLTIRDKGVAGHEVITKLDQLLTKTRQGITVVACKLQLLLQRAQTAGGFSHNGGIKNAADLLSDFSITLNIVDRRQTEFPFPAGLVDPCVKSDISSIRVKAEKQAPGMGGFLRVIFCQFVVAPICGEHSFFGVTEGGPKPLENGMMFPDFILINVRKSRPDKTTLIHEMIHATGLTTHDNDPESVFSTSSNRTVLKPEHAQLFSGSTFSRRRD